MSNSQCDVITVVTTKWKLSNYGILLSAPSYGGAIYSYTGTSKISSIVSNRYCSFILNSGDFGGALAIRGKHMVYNFQNVFERNTAGTGSIITCMPSANSGKDISIWIDNDRIYNNIATEATLHGSKLSKLVIHNTHFFNNSAADNIAGIYIENEVEEFVCYGCDFQDNTAASGGILSILSAEKVNISSSFFINNVVDFGKMIELRKSRKTTITNSYLENNTCSGLPCHMYVDKAIQLHIASCQFITNEKSQYVSSHAMSFSGENVRMIDIQMDGIAGHVLETLSSGSSLQIKNLSCLCPKGHTFLANLDDSNETQSVPKHTFLKRSLVLNCEPCPMNHYRIGLSTYSLELLGEKTPANSIDQCFPCPPGGICKNHEVIAEPNYWGFVHQNELYFVFCSINYCCPSSPCESYDMCNEGRTGSLCTSCKDGYLLRMMESKCAPMEKCTQGWVYIVTVATAIAYIGFLLVKVEIVNVALAVYNKCRHVLRKPLNRRLMCIKYLQSHEQRSEKVRTKADSNLSIVIKKPNKDHNSEWEIPFDSVEIFHIIVFHMQDTNLFKIRLPNMPTSLFSLEKYQKKILSVFSLDAIFSENAFCFAKGSTEVTKVLLDCAVVPFMIFIFLVCCLILKVLKLKEKKYNRLMTTANTIFLLIIMFSSQKLSTSAFSLVKCEWLGSGWYLLIDSSVKCYQLWQGIVFLYLFLFILPFWLSLFIAPGLLHHRLISQRTFLVGLLFPGPFVLYSVWLLHRNKDRPVRACCHRQTTTAILNEVWDSFSPFFSYKYFCWGGIVELRRLGLVICSSMIATPIGRIIPMILITMTAYTVHFKFNPYSDKTANACANVSLCTMLMVGIINFGWATLLYSGSGFEYGNARKIGEGLLASEQWFTQGLVVAIISFCAIRFLIFNVPKCH